MVRSSILSPLLEVGCTSSGDFRLNKTYHLLKVEEDRGVLTARAQTIKSSKIANPNEIVYGGLDQENFPHRLFGGVDFLIVCRLQAAPQVRESTESVIDAGEL